MSILNAFVTPDAALLGVDTEAGLPDGELQQVCKLIVNPPLSAIAGFRGLDLMQMAAAPVFTGWKGTFDHLAEYVPDLMRLCEEHCVKNHGQVREQLMSDFVLTGFSESAGRMVLHAYQRTSHTKPIAWHRDIPQFYAPYWGRLILSPSAFALIGRAWRSLPKSNAAGLARMGLWILLAVVVSSLPRFANTASPSRRHSTFRHAPLS